MASASAAPGRHARIPAGRRGSTSEDGRRGRPWAASAPEELVVPGGTPYAVGGRVVARREGRDLGDGDGGGLDLEAMALVVRTDDDRQLRRLESEEIAADRLAQRLHGDRPSKSRLHRRAGRRSGGQRRAGAGLRQDEPGQGPLHRLRRRRRRRPGHRGPRAGVVDRAPAGVGHPPGHAGHRPCRRRGQPARGPAHARRLRRGRLAAERAAILAIIPPDPSAEMRAVEREQARLRGQRDSLAAATGHYDDEPVGHAVWELRQAEIDIVRLERHVERPEVSRKDQPPVAGRARSGERAAPGRKREPAAITEPETARLDEEGRRLEGHLSGLRAQAIEHRAWVERHPEAARRLDRLTTEIGALDLRLDGSRGVRERAVGLSRDGPCTTPPVVRRRDLGIDLGR